MTHQTAPMGRVLQLPLNRPPTRDPQQGSHAPEGDRPPRPERALTIMPHQPTHIPPETWLYWAGLGMAQAAIVVLALLRRRSLT